MSLAISATVPNLVIGVAANPLTARVGAAAVLAAFGVQHTCNPLVSAAIAGEGAIVCACAVPPPTANAIPPAPPPPPPPPARAEAMDWTMDTVVVPPAKVDMRMYTLV